jgi:murein DD-endopeptidase MepM/ murein hydrolase activator NlpD
VLAVTDGEVARVELSILYGKQIMVNHDQTSAGFRVQSRYFHLSEQLVMPGEKVSRGQLLGFSGATGLAAGVFPHFHFEVYRLNQESPPLAIKNIDPQLFWVDGVGMITCFDIDHEYSSDYAAFTYPVPCKGIAWR